MNAEDLFPNAPKHFYAKLPQPLPEPSECFQWQGFIRDNGYGELSVNGKTRLAHRVAYELANGPIPEDHDIDHVVKAGCTTRACVNPAHLEAVSHAENMLRQGDALPERLRAYTIKDSAQAAELGRKSGEARRLKAEAKRRDQEIEQARQQRVLDVVTLPARSDLAVRIRETTAQILDALLTGDIPIRNGKEAADLIGTLHAVQRLEEGQPTSMSATITQDLDTWKTQLTQRLTG